MLFVQGETFQMGLTKQESVYMDEYPDHEVFVSHFQMSLTPVTVAQYRHYCEAEDKSMPATPSFGYTLISKLLVYLGVAVSQLLILFSIGYFIFPTLGLPQLQIPHAIL